MERLQRTCALATDAITRRYFAGAESLTWQGVAAVSMQLRIVHTTTFEYDGKAVASYNQARLTPLTTPEPDRVAQPGRGLAGAVDLRATATTSAPP